MKHYTLILEDPSAQINFKYLKKCPQKENYWIAFDGMTTKKAVIAMVNQLRAYCKRPLLFVGRDCGRWVKI